MHVLSTEDIWEKDNKAGDSRKFTVTVQQTEGELLNGYRGQKSAEQQPCKPATIC